MDWVRSHYFSGFTIVKPDGLYGACDYEKSISNPIFFLYIYDLQISRFHTNWNGHASMIASNE